MGPCKGQLAASGTYFWLQQSVLSRLLPDHILPSQLHTCNSNEGSSAQCASSSVHAATQHHMEWSAQACMPAHACMPARARSTATNCASTSVAARLCGPCLPPLLPGLPVSIPAPAVVRCMTAASALLSRAVVARNALFCCCAASSCCRRRRACASASAVAPLPLLCAGGARGMALAAMRCT